MQTTDEPKGNGLHNPNPHEQPSSPSSPAAAAAASSPSHEFSFTISFHPSSVSKNAPPQFAAVDLSPADDIFFQGQLLPLHHPASPRSSSTNSMDSFTLPAMDLFSSENNDSEPAPAGESSLFDGGRACGKSKSFSLFGLPRRRNGPETAEAQKGKSKLDHLSRFVAKYVRLMRTALRKGRESCPEIDRRQSKFSSFSGNLKLRSRFKGLRGRKEFSAPATTRNSPANSGVLTSTGNSSNTSDSTMEDLQAAIQAAIAHCKNSIAAGVGSDMDNKIKQMP